MSRKSSNVSNSLLSFSRTNSIRSDPMKKRFSVVPALNPSALMKFKLFGNENEKKPEPEPKLKSAKTTFSPEKVTAETLPHSSEKEKLK